MSRAKYDDLIDDLVSAMSPLLAYYRENPKVSIIMTLALARATEVLGRVKAARAAGLGRVNPEALIGAGRIIGLTESVEIIDAAIDRARHLPERGSLFESEVARQDAKTKVEALRAVADSIEKIAGANNAPRAS